MVLIGGCPPIQVKSRTRVRRSNEFSGCLTAWPAGCVTEWVHILDDGSDKEEFSEPIKRKLASAICSSTKFIYSEGKKGMNLADDQC